MNNLIFKAIFGSLDVKIDVINCVKLKGDHQIYSINKRCLQAKYCIKINSSIERIIYLQIHSELKHLSNYRKIN